MPVAGWRYTMTMEERWWRNDGGRVDGGFDGTKGWRAANIYHWG